MLRLKNLGRALSAPTFCRSGVRFVVIGAIKLRLCDFNPLLLLRWICRSNRGFHNKMPSTDSCLEEPQVELRFARLSKNAHEPTRGSEQAAGFDLRSAYEYTIPASGKTVILTDIQIALPPGCYGRVAPRSGLAAKHFIDVGAGVIDQDYRGNVGVVLFNFGTEEFKVAKGDRVAQLILERIFIPKLVELKNLDNTNRGSGGFGSTGQN